MAKLKQQYNKLLLEDSRNLEKFFPADNPLVDLIITSPPYWDMKEYGKIQNQIGYGQSREEYFNDISQILKSCFRITKDSGSLWLISDTFRREGALELLPFDLAEIAKSANWKLRDLVIWDKQYALPWHQKGQMRSTSEYILVLTKSDNYKFYTDRIKDIDELSRWWVDFPERFNPKGKTPTNIWRFPIRRRGTWPNPSVINHFCPFPTKLVARIIELTTDENDFVFDPFAGSGVVLAQAEQMKRRFLGLEVNPDYIKMYKTAVKKAVAEEWKEVETQRKNDVTSMRGFEKTIMSLRILKYARQAIKFFAEQLTINEMTKVLCAVCFAEIPSEYDRDSKLNIELWFIGKKKHTFMNSQLKKTGMRLLQAPLSHYGISSVLFSETQDEFLQLKKKLKSNRFYLYPIQRIRKFSEAAALDKWFENDKILKSRNGNAIPLLTNIEIDVSWADE